MSSVSALQGIGVQNGSETDTSGRNRAMGKDDFLNLLVTQLKNQDPLNPSDPTEFTAQLAQYSSLEQLYNINDSMQGIGNLEEEFGRMSALYLIDKQVIAESDELNYTGEPVEIGFRFSDSVENAVVAVKGENGQIIDTREVMQPGDENHFFQWDGTDQNGEPVAEGSYFLEVTGTTGEGKEVQGASLVESRVTGVDFSDSAQTLMTTTGRVSLSEIIRVNNPTLTAESGD